MKQSWSSGHRRLAWLAAGGVAVVVMLPLVPALASTLSGQSDGPAVGGAANWASLQIVPAGATTAGGQIQQPAAGMPIFVGCPAGRAVGGGYSLPGAGHDGMLVSAPDETNSARWLFRYPGQIPVGSKFYAVCWGA